jgi:hypothetical protein
MPVVKYYRDNNKVVEVSRSFERALFIRHKLSPLNTILSQVDATDSVDAVYSKVKVAVDAALAAQTIATPQASSVRTE